MKQGIVIRSHSGVYTVHADGELYHCQLRGNLKKDLTYSTSTSLSRRVTRARRAWSRDTIAIGDRVRFADTHDGAGIIEEVLDRTTRFARAGFRGKEHVLVCNLDLAVIVFACAEPRVDPWKLDRFLVVAELEGLEPLVVANKAELVSEEERAAAFGEWEGLGYRVAYTSAHTGLGIEALRAALDGRISAFVGPSGTGKSSLLNAIQPGLSLRTSDIGHVTFKGRHTTVGAQLIPLRTGGWVADTPGLRQLEFMDAGRDEVLQGFPELRELGGGCRFDDCRHDTEPGCAIRQAVEDGAVSRRRYQSFIQMSEGA